MLNATLLSVLLLNAILPSFLLLNAINDILLSVVLLSVSRFCDFLLSDNAECRSAECPLVECYK